MNGFPAFFYQRIVNKIISTSSLILENLLRSHRSGIDGTDYFLRGTENNPNNDVTVTLIDFSFTYHFVSEFILVHSTTRLKFDRDWRRKLDPNLGRFVVTYYLEASRNARPGTFSLNRRQWPSSSITRI